MNTWAREYGRVCYEAFRLLARYKNERRAKQISKTIPTLPPRTLNSPQYYLKQQRNLALSSRNMIPMAIVSEKISITTSTPTGEQTLNIDTTMSKPLSAEACARPTLLLLHFWGGSGMTFFPLFQKLIGDYPIIAPSFRGWGKSDGPADPDAYHTRHHVGDILKLLSCLQQKRQYSEISRNGLVIVGHSMGAKVAQILLHQEEIADRIKGVVLIAPAPAGSIQLSDEMREFQSRAYETWWSAKRAVETVLLGQFENVSAEGVHDLAKDAVSGSAGAKAAWPSYGMGEEFELLFRCTVHNWPKGKLQALIVIGERDGVEPERTVRERVVQVLLEEGANVRTIVIPDVGHLIPVEAPKELAESIRGFVAGLG